MNNAHSLNRAFSHSLIPPGEQGLRPNESAFPFTAAELNNATQQAEQETLQKLVRLAVWEKLPYETTSFGQQPHIKSMAMWSSRQVVSWTVNGDAFDLFAPLYFSEPLLKSLGHWLALWQAEGIDRSALKRFAAELNNSIDNEAMAICFRQQWNVELQQDIGNQPFWQGLKALDSFNENPALFFEQWGAVGHPVHPTIKAKQGVSATTVFATAPEFKGQARLRIAAIARDQCVLEGGAQADYLAMFERNFPEQMRDWQSALGEKAKQYLPLPVHPVQVDSRWQEELPAGLVLPVDAPTINSYASLSYRTVYPEGGASKPFIKLPVALRMTSTQRTVSPRSCQMGPRVSQLLLEITARDKQIQQSFTPLPEMWGLHLDAPSAVAKHFSVIYRAPLSEVLDAGDLAIPVAALAAKTPANKSLISHILTSDTQDIARLLPGFRLYVHHVLNGALALYLKYGITLEAHQQNSLLKINSSNQVRGFIIRDFGGVRIHRESLLEKGLSLNFHPDPLILAEHRGQCRQKLIHTLYICHLGALVSALSADFAIPSGWLWRIVAESTQEVFDLARPAMSPLNYTEDIRCFLASPWQTKAFIRMRLEDTSDDIWTQIENPLKHWA
ncbi:MAG: hypothetical protein KBT88_11315 [Gammaproteobacteria bacterium]|nr:hypothetical protein [Gammaproteobacteria bacterium]MBQ0840364.1 hypothetical protein [Gammaproteobacteria bacterium]